MTDLLHVLLGNHGDLCLAAPALKRYADTHGRPAKLLTSKACAPMLEGCSYVEVVDLPATYHDLHSVMKFLKNDVPQIPVKCLQFYQSGDTKCLPSFWHEQMWLAGLLGGGEDEPLVFDRRDEEREGILRVNTRSFGKDRIYDHRPYILLALTGQSSPIDSLANGFISQAIQSEFPSHNIIDLSKVKAERIYDLLGLYDHAAALVSIDTVHLHLSKASKVPVFALARDYPERWHGTPQLERFTWYCRYGQVMERVDELIEAVRATLEGQQKPKPNFTNIPKGSYNPSIIVHEGETLMSYRHHPERTWRTQLKINGDPVKFPYPVGTCAHEDMRLFTFQDELWASYVCSRGSKMDPKCAVGFGKLQRVVLTSGGVQEVFWAIEKHYQPAMPDNDFKGMSKNAVLFSHDERLWMIWKNGITIRLMPGHVAGFDLLCESEPATWPYGEIRGGTSPLPFHGKWLRFFHSRIWDKESGKPWRYYMGALVMEPNPPFNVLHVSKTPILCGDESGDPMVWHWKHSCVLAYGAVEDEDGWLVSLGINDAHCAVIRLKEEDLNL